MHLINNIYFLYVLNILMNYYFLFSKRPFKKREEEITYN